VSEANVRTSEAAKKTHKFTRKENTGECRERERDLSSICAN